jgi:hypothetical protein
MLVVIDDNSKIAYMRSDDWHRHCERSEAIQLHKSGLLRRFTPRNDGLNDPKFLV